MAAISPSFVLVRLISSRTVAACSKSSGKPKSGEMTAQLSLWDAGTEVNEEPGLGPNQGPRQTAPDAGVTEHQGIAHVHDKYAYPRTGDVLRMTITSAGDEMSRK